MDKTIHMLILLTSSSLFLLTTFPRSHCQQDNEYTICSGQYIYSGADYTTVDISYPLWGQLDGIRYWEVEPSRPAYCGGGDSFKLNSSDNSIQVGSQNFEVRVINTTARTIKLVRRDLVSNFCSPEFDDTYLSPTLFRYADSVFNVTIHYNCSSFAEDMYFEHNFTCGNEHGIFDDDENASPLTCERRVQVPVDVNRPLHDAGGISVLEKALEIGFEVNYVVNQQECTRCLESGGVCGSNQAAQAEYQFSCYCPDGSNGLHCSVHESNHSNRQRKVIIGITSATVVGLLICMTIFCSICKPSTWRGKLSLMMKSNQDIEAFLKSHGAQTLIRYKFSDVKKMTNSFKVKLGQGGFGIVYKGKLTSNSLVAMKILNSSKGNGQEFINEVASISRTSHVNVVTLLGFCLEGHKKALIYEFMPNGSLDRFIYKEGQKTIASLSLESLYQIAIGIAQGLEYLHKGCNTRILHFDIKPHNILLDENCCPKISDFGLAKLCPRNNSIISMSDPRGTCGYLAPEMWNRRYGGVSQKSDVYSYGMILLDMVEGRKNTIVEANHSSETYFPDWIYNRLEQSNLRPDDGVITIEENEIVRRMIIVGLWCIQTFPHDRPTISRVIDMLEGSQNSLEIPPKPILCSSARSVQESSTS